MKQKQIIIHVDMDAFSKIRTAKGFAWLLEREHSISWAIMAGLLVSRLR